MWHVLGTGEMHAGLWWGGLGKRDHLKDLSVDGRMIIKRGLEEIGWVGIHCTDLAQDRDSWRAVVNAVMNLLVP